MEVSSKFLVEESFDLSIRMILLLPYALFRKLWEPTIFTVYETVIQPFYTQFIKKIPILNIIISMLLRLVAWCIMLVSFILQIISGKRRHDLSGGENHYQLSETIGEEFAKRVTKSIRSRRVKL